MNAGMVLGDRMDKIFGGRCIGTLLSSDADSVISVRTTRECLGPIVDGRIEYLLKGNLAGDRMVPRSTRRAARCTSRGPLW